MKLRYFMVGCLVLVCCCSFFLKRENRGDYVVQSDRPPKEIVSVYISSEKEPISEYLYYEIPERFEKADLPEDMQEYLYDECKDRHIEYSIALAIIERESGYNPKCSGDNGNSKGYMQVYQKWHEEEMAEENVKDLFDPQGNIRVGLHILQDLYEKYGSSGDSCVLMVYNMGDSTAKGFWEKGIYSTEYTREILNRSKEIKQDLKQD